MHFSRARRDKEVFQTIKFTVTVIRHRNPRNPTVTVILSFSAEGVGCWRRRGSRVNGSGQVRGKAVPDYGDTVTPQ